MTGRWPIGAYALIFGVLIIALGFRLRAIGQQLTKVDERGQQSTGG